MTAQTLNKELIENPALWRLLLLIDDDNLVVVANSTVEDSSLIHVKLPYDSAAASPIRAIEDVIYSNPLLLSDFNKVECIVRSKHFLIVPTATDEQSANVIAGKLWNDNSLSIITDEVANLCANIVWAVDAQLVNFLVRTFNNPRIVHHLTPLARYFSRKNRLGNSGKMYVNLRRNYLDVIAFNGGKVSLINSYEYQDKDDATYFVLAVANEAGFNLDDDELMICGDVALREQIMPELRRFVNYVMPVIFPSAMFRAGKEALNAPFELILLPLCE
jgi:hypothetical protein